MLIYILLIHDLFMTIHSLFDEDQLVIVSKLLLVGTDKLDIDIIYI